MAHRLAPQAVEDLDSIWFYVATESGSIDAANRLVDSLTRRFLLLPNIPTWDACVQEPNVLILRVVHGHRDLATWFSES